MTIQKKRKSLDEIFSDSSEQIDRDSTENNSNRKSLDEIFNDNNQDSSQQNKTDYQKSGNPVLDRISDTNNDPSKRKAALEATVAEATRQKNNWSNTLDKLGGLSDKFLGGLTEVAKGVGKGALSTIKNTSNLGEKVLSYATGNGKLKNTAFDNTQSFFENKLDLNQGDLVTPNNTAQKVGKYGEQIGEFFIPGSKLGKAGEALSGVKALQNLGNSSKIAKIGQKVAQNVVRLAPEALVGSAQNSIQEGDTKNFFRDALLFGGLSRGGEIIGKAAKSAVEKIPGRLVDSAIKPTLDEVKKSIKFNGKTLGQEIIDRGIVGSDKKLLKTAQDGLGKNEDKLQNILKNSKATISRNELSTYLEPLVEKFSKTPGLESEFNTLTKVLDEVPKVLPISEANVYKRNIYNALNDTAFKLDPSLSGKKEVMKTLASGFKDLIEKKTAKEAGEGTVKKINQELSVHGRLQDRILDKLAKSEKKNIIGLGDVVTGGAGAAVGGLPGLVASTAINKLAGSTSFKTNGAVILDRIGKNIDKLPLDKAGKISKASLVKLFHDLSDSGVEQKNLDRKSLDEIFSSEN